MLSIEFLPFYKTGLLPNELSVFSGWVVAFAEVSLVVVVVVEPAAAVAAEASVVTVGVVVTGAGAATTGSSGLVSAGVATFGVLAADDVALGYLFYNWIKLRECSNLN